MPAIIQFLGYNPLPEAQGRGERLVRQRTTLGLSQKASAQRLGVDPSTLAKWERGEREPTGALLSRLTRFLDEEEESKATGPVLGTLQLTTP
jgi:transcriptional regulator with XRE-family HTH domain